MEAPIRVFSDQHDVKTAFSNGELDKDVIVVVRFQGAGANGMPELHSLSPVLGSLQDAGHHVALVTDGRMSGASGKIPAAIHLSPEGARGGPIAKLRDGDLVRLDATTGTLEFLGDWEEFNARKAVIFRPNESASGLGREMFSTMRDGASLASEGASFFRFPGLG